MRCANRHFCTPRFLCKSGISYINQFAKFLKQEHRGNHGADNELLYLGEITG